MLSSFPIRYIEGNTQREFRQNFVALFRHPLAIYCGTVKERREFCKSTGKRA